MSDTTGAATPNGEVTGEDTQQNGTSDEQARNGQDENTGKLNMEWKDKATNWNKVETLMHAYGVSTIDELNERLARSPAAQGESDPEVDPVAEDEEMAARQFAAKGDPVAKLTLKLLEKNKRLEQANERLARGVEDAFVAKDIDPGKRQKILNHYNANRHRFADLKGAAAEIEVEDAKAEVRRLTDELARHRKNGVTPNAPSTHVADVAPGKTNDTKKMKQSEFRAEIERLDGEGKHAEKMALQRKRRLFEIEVTPD